MATNVIDQKELKKRMDGAISVLRHELSGLRTGRASASLLDPIMVVAYGQSMPIGQVGTVTVPEPRMVSVQVWDKSMVGAVEKAIRESSLGLNPITEGTLLRIPLPELNEERRRELAKIAHQYAEQAKVAIRHVRRDGMDDLKKAEKEGELGQDEARSLSEQVQKLTDEYIGSVDETLAAKEKEIMQV
jgi:ribosome recycling factor